MDDRKDASKSSSAIPFSCSTCWEEPGCEVWKGARGLCISFRWASKASLSCWYSLVLTQLSVAIR